MTPVRLPCPAPSTFASLAFALVLVSPMAHAQHAHLAGMQMQSHDDAAVSTPQLAAGDDESTHAGAPAIDQAAMDHGQAASPPAIDHAAVRHASPASTLREPIAAVTAEDIAAAFPVVAAHKMHDDDIYSFVLFDRLEADVDSDAQSWAAQAWIGTDRNRLWLRSEGERSGPDTHAADLELFYGRAVARWWDLLVGIRHDFKPAGAQDFLAVGVTGLAPYKFEVSATGYLGASGQTAARIEIEYETLLSNRLVLQPLLEADFYGKDDPRRGLGSGLATVEAGLRLRYEFTRRFAPYVGVVRERAFGETAALRRDNGDDTGDTRFVAGLRFWF